MDFFEVKKKVGAAAAFEICCHIAPKQVAQGVIESLTLSELSMVFSFLSEDIQCRVLDLLAVPGQGYVTQKLCLASLFDALDDSQLPESLGRFIFGRTVQTIIKKDVDLDGLERLAKKSIYRRALSLALSYTVAWKVQEDKERPCGGHLSSSLPNFQDIKTRFVNDDVLVIFYAASLLRLSDYQYFFLNDCFFWGRKFTSKELGCVLVTRNITQCVRDRVKQYVLSQEY